MPPSRVIVLHGTMGNPSGNWFPWLKNSLLPLSVNVHVPLFPTPEDQSLENWKEVFRKEVGELLQSDILIGHSLGAAFALSLLEESTSKIEAFISVCGFFGKLAIEPYDTLNHSFISKPFNWHSIHSSFKHAVVVAGDNDKYVSKEMTRELSKKLNAPLHLITGGGHLNAESGYVEFPELLSLTREFLSV